MGCGRAACSCHCLKGEFRCWGLSSLWSWVLPKVCWDLWNTAFLPASPHGLHCPTSRADGLGCPLTACAVNKRCPLDGARLVHRQCLHPGSVM